MADTIFARASGAGRAAIAVVRISGPDTSDVLERLIGRRPKPRHATLATLRHPTAGLPVDRGLVLWFPGPASFTGEDAAELHLHGGRAVVAAVLEVLGALPGLRHAEPGEFTRRALRHGKMRLDEVEGLADLIDAETEAQRRQALRAADGALGRWVDGLRAQLVAAIALTEGAIDFAEEDDLADAFRRDMAADVGRIRTTVRGQLDASTRGERLRDGLAVAIVGAPNVGKSTLLNALAGREAAIVSVHAGTTRDPIEVDLDLGGYPLRLIDTAGLRDTEDPVEREGMARARQRAASADLVLWLRETSDEVPPQTGGALWSLAPKADIEPAAIDADFVLSARTGWGMDALIEALQNFAEAALAGGEDALATRLRHRIGLQRALGHLRAVEALGADAPLELVAEELRGAVAALSSLVGDVDTEEILGEIFARFCIGK